MHSGSLLQLVTGASQIQLPVDDVAYLVAVAFLSHMVPVASVALFDCLLVADA